MHGFLAGEAVGAAVHQGRFRHVAGGEDAFAPVRLDALVVAVGRAAAVVDDRELAACRPHADDGGVVVTEGRDLVVDEGGGARPELDGFFAEQEAGEVEVVDRHVPEDPARCADVGGGR